MALLTLRNGASVPVVGYGLYQVPAAEAEACARRAIECGYRHLDSASFYGNEAGVGAAIAGCGVARDELFVATKVWTDCIGARGAAVRSSVLKSLELLRCGYLDLVYVHWPVPGRHVEAYGALEALVQEGRVRMLGLSNYRPEDYEELEPTLRVAPVVNQIEVNPWLHRRDCIDYFAARGIRTIAFKSLVRGAGLDDATVAEIAAKHARTPAQVLLQWGVQHGYGVLPKSANPERMAQNLLTSQSPFLLDAGDLDSLAKLQSPDALAAYQAQFAKRSAADPNGPTLPVYSAPALAPC